MKDIIPKDSRYIPFTQQKSCCVPASIWMIMYKRGIPLIPQELLGWHLGLVVDPKYRKLFWNGNAMGGKKPKSGYGTGLSSGKINPNSVFKKLKIPLRMEYHPISKFRDQKNLKTFLTDIEKKNKDVLTCFDSGYLNNKLNSRHNGHLSVIDRVYITKNLLRIIDPSPKYAKWRYISIDKLKKAMEFHGDENHAGFWEFKKVSS